MKNKVKQARSSNLRKATSVSKVATKPASKSFKGRYKTAMDILSATTRVEIAAVHAVTAKLLGRTKL